MLLRMPPQARTTTSCPSPTATVSSREPTPNTPTISNCILLEAIEMTRPILVGIAGGSGSGKTTVAEKIMHETTQPVVFLKQDSYYRNFDGMSIEEKRAINYDHPSAYDNDPVSYTHLRAHETRHDLVCRLLLEKKKKTK